MQAAGIGSEREPRTFRGGELEQVEVLRRFELAADSTWHSDGSECGWIIRRRCFNHFGQVGYRQGCETARQAAGEFGAKERAITERGKGTGKNRRGNAVHKWPGSGDLACAAGLHAEWKRRGDERKITDPQPIFAAGFVAIVAKLDDVNAVGGKGLADAAVSAEGQVIVNQSDFLPGCIQYSQHGVKVRTEPRGHDFQRQPLSGLGGEFVEVEDWAIAGSVHRGLRRNFLSRFHRVVVAVIRQARQIVNHQKQWVALPFASGDDDRPHAAGRLGRERDFAEQRGLPLHIGVAGNRFNCRRKAAPNLQRLVELATRQNNLGRFPRSSGGRNGLRQSRLTKST